VVLKLFHGGDVATLYGRTLYPALGEKSSAILRGGDVKIAKEKAKFVIVKK
jgi:hypothetical protein